MQSLILRVRRSAAVVGVAISGAGLILATAHGDEIFGHLWAGILIACTCVASVTSHTDAASMVAARRSTVGVSLAALVSAFIYAGFLDALPMTVAGLVAVVLGALLALTPPRGH